MSKDNNQERYPFTRYEQRAQPNRWGGYDYPFVEAARVVGPKLEHEIRVEPGGRISYIPRRRRQEGDNGGKRWQK